MMEDRKRSGRKVGGAGKEEEHKYQHTLGSLRRLFDITTLHQLLKLEKG